MKNKELFIKALTTLLYSWGGETPPDAIWAANDFLKWYEAEYNVTLPDNFDVDGSNHEQVFAALENH